MLLSDRMVETVRDVYRLITDARPIGEFPEIKVRFFLLAVCFSFIIKDVLIPRTFVELN